jgi:hypothetical protein
MLLSCASALSREGGPRSKICCPVRKAPAVVLGREQRREDPRICSGRDVVYPPTG